MAWLTSVGMAPLSVGLRGAGDRLEPIDSLHLVPILGEWDLPGEIECPESVYHYHRIR